MGTGIAKIIKSRVSDRLLQDANLIMLMNYHGIISFVPDTSKVQNNMSERQDAMLFETQNFYF